MKKYILIICLSCFGYLWLAGQNTWELLSSPVDEDLLSCYFISNDIGWIVSEEGSILHTSDGGMIWQQLQFPDVCFSAVYFADMNFGCAVGWKENGADSSVILLTNDGGNNWNFAEHPAVKHLNDVFFINNTRGWAVGCLYENNINCCLYTEDGGMNWEKQTGIAVMEAELFAVHFRDDNVGNSCGHDGAFFTTNSGGMNGWALGISMPLIDLNDIFNYGTQGGCMVGDEGTALYTNNNWGQYVESNTSTNAELNAVSGYPEANKFWAVGDNGTIIYSPNLLLGWIIQEAGVNENLHDICILNEFEGWAVGDNGTLLRMVPASSVEENISAGVTVFPNPLINNTLKIHLDQPLEFTCLQLADLNGKIIYERNDLLSRLIEINVADLPAGVYYINLYGHNQSFCKKILVF